MTDQPGLRERKKQATREALLTAALRLAATQPWEAVRVQDIAARAGVSTRTFNNYFASKEDVFLSPAYERAALAEAALAARPPDEPLWSALSAAIASTFAERDLDLRHARLIRSSAVVARVQHEAFAVIEQRLASSVARRIGCDIEQDFYPRLVAATAVSATRAALDFWIQTEPKRDLRLVLQETFECIAAGLVPPR